MKQKSAHMQSSTGRMEPWKASGQEQAEDETDYSPMEGSTNDYNRDMEDVGKSFYD